MEYYIGISAGSSRIKLVCINLEFDTIDLNYKIKNCIQNKLDKYKDVIDIHDDCYENQDNVLQNISWENIWKKITKFELCFNINKNRNMTIFEILTDICDFINELKIRQIINIGSVGFSFPDIIDYDTKKIKQTHLLNNMTDLGLQDLLDENVYEQFIGLFKNNDNNLENYVFDTNSNAACVAEKEIGNIGRALQGKSNLLVIYGGYGYGIGLVLNNKLFSGTKRGGRLGHIQVIPYTKSNNTVHTKCRCGQENCLENRINLDVFERNSSSISEEEFKAKTITELCKSLENDYNKNALADYLAQACYTLSQLFGTENIVLTGKLSKFYPIIKNELNNILVTKYSIMPQIIKASTLGEFSAAKGIAIESYYYKYKMPLEWK